MEGKSLLLTQLKELVRVLEESEQDMLNMDRWFEESALDTCGYAACICGEVALKGDLSLFETNGLVDDPSDTVNIASIIADTLDTACINVFGRKHLVESIYSGTATTRFFMAEKSNMFSFSEINSFNHLLKKDPTPSDAIEYIEAVIAKVEGLEEK